MIDSHHHFWNYDTGEYGWIDESMGVLRRDFLPPDLEAVAEVAGVKGAVSVQARESLAETESLLRHARECGLVRGVVGWAPLKDADVAGIVDRFAADPYFKGVREITQGRPDEEFYANDDFDRGIRELTRRGLPYDILLCEDQLPAAVRFVDRHPGQAFVLDHIGKPVIRAAAFSEAWANGIRELGQRENVVCKFSGVVTEVRDPEWDIDLVRPYFETALEAFGADRLMVGSDWPVCLLRTEYGKWVETVRVLAAGLSEDEKARLFGDVATKVYSL